MNYNRCMKGYCKTCPDDTHCPFDKKNRDEKKQEEKNKNNYNINKNKEEKK